MLGLRSYELDAGDFTVQIDAPYREGRCWFCRVWSGDAPHPFDITIHGVDAIHAIRRALQTLDEELMHQPLAS